MSLSEDALLRQNRALRQEVDELRETVRQLRAADRPDVLPDWLPRLSPTEAAVMRVFWARSCVHQESILAALYNGDTRSPAIVRQWVHRLRQKLAGTPVSIKNLGPGLYRLDRQAYENSSKVNEDLRVSGRSNKSLTSEAPHQ